MFFVSRFFLTIVTSHDWEDCPKNLNGDIFRLIIRARSSFDLAVLESLMDQVLVSNSSDSGSLFQKNSRQQLDLE